MTNPNRPRSVADAVRAARRRMGLSGLLIRLGPSLAAGASVSLLLVLAIKLFGSRVGLVPSGVWSWVALIAAPVAVGAVWAILKARRNWPSEVAAASRLDAVSGLADLLGSALIFSHRRQIVGFEAITLQQADSDLSKVNIREVAPLRLTKPWSWAAIGLGLAGLGAAYVPAMPPPAIRPTRIVRTPAPVEIQHATEEITSIKKDLEEAVDMGAASESDLKALEELEQELLDGRRDPEDAKSAAAATLERAAQAARQEAEQARAKTEALRERLAEIDPESFDVTKPLAGALSAGDFDAAAESVEHLRDMAAQNDPESIAEELRQLAEAVEPQPASESADEPAVTEPQSKEQIQEELERQGVPEDEAERLAEQEAQRQQQRAAEREAERQADEQAREIAEQLRRDADEIAPDPLADEPGEPQPEPAGSQPPEDDPKDQPDADSPPPNPPGMPAPSPDKEPSPNATQPQPGQQQEQNEPESSASPESTYGQEPDPSPGEEANPEGEQQDAPSQPGKDGQPKPGGEPSPDGTPSEESPPKTGQDPGSPDASKPAPGMPGQPTGQPTPDAQPKTGEKPDPNGTGPGGGTGSGQGDDNATGLTDMLRDLADQQDTAEQVERLADRLEHQSDRLAGLPSPPSTQKQAPLPPTLDSPWDGQTEVVDARREPTDQNIQEQVISEWYNPDARPGDSIGEVGAGGDASKIVDLARRQAQRALEQQAVPKRRAELVKRIFDRLAERAETVSRDRPSPAVDAEDAP